MMTTKLEIIGPYTPEHEGPFCTRDGRPVRILCIDMKGITPILGLAQDGDMELIVIAGSDGVTKTMSRNYDLMNAREVPVAREFWVVGGLIFNDEKEARRIQAKVMLSAELIHVREVLEGEEA